ncbi:MAG: hypothetical protein ACK4WF_00065 [Candidatus Brocadiales bacterium]
MDRRRKLLIGVLAFLFIVAVYRNYNLLFKGTPPVKTKATAPTAGKGDRAAAPARDLKERVAAAVAPSATGIAVKFEPIDVDPYFLEGQLASGQWGREPFLTPEELRPVMLVEEAPPEEEETLPDVRSVLVSGGKKVAIINGEWYGVGDLVMGTKYRVADITVDGVMLEKAGQQKLKQVKPNPAGSKIRIRSREK